MDDDTVITIVQFFFFHLVNYIDIEILKYTRVDKRINSFEIKNPNKRAKNPNKRAKAKETKPTD